MCHQGINIFEDVQKTNKNVIRDACCPGRYCARQNCVGSYTWRENGGSCYEGLQCKACCQVLNISFEDQTLAIKFFGGDGKISFAKMTSHRSEAPKATTLLQHYLSQSQSNKTDPGPKKARTISFTAKSFKSPIS